MEPGWYSIFSHKGTCVLMILLNLFLKGTVCGGEDERGCSRKENLWSATEKCRCVSSFSLHIVLEVLIPICSWNVEALTPVFPFLRCDLLVIGNAFKCIVLILCIIGASFLFSCGNEQERSSSVYSLPECCNSPNQESEHLNFPCRWQGPECRSDLRLSQTH